MARYILLGSVLGGGAVQVGNLAKGRIENTRNGGATNGTWFCNSLISHDMQCHFLHCDFAVSI